MSKIKAFLTGILNIILFIPRKIFHFLLDFWCFLVFGIADMVEFIWDKFDELRASFKSKSPKFTKVVPRAYEIIKDPMEVLIDECSGHNNNRFFSYSRKSDKAIEALAEVMCPHGEFGCGKVNCNVSERDRKKNFKIKKEQLEREYVKNTFHRNYKWKLEFGREKDDIMLLWARSAKIVKKPTFFKKGLMEVTFYSRPAMIDYLAGCPKTKVARMTFVEGDGSLMSYIEFKKFKLKDVDLSSLDFDYTKAEIMVIKTHFSFSKSKFFGTVTTNGVMEKAV